MRPSALNLWIDRLGYSAAGASIHRAPGDAPADHPYGRDLDLVLGELSEGAEVAVVDIERIPTVLFVSTATDGLSTSPNQLDILRQQIWNQNLISIVVAVDGDSAQALPVLRRDTDGQRLSLESATPSGVLSYLDIASGRIQERHPEWFDIEARVDRELLENLRLILKILQSHGLTKAQAQLLLGQILFVSYLEHREIVGDYYQSQRGVDKLHALIKRIDRAGLGRLFAALKSDFNGDFLAIEGAPHVNWAKISDHAFHDLDLFLSRVSLETGQQAFWNYDFRYIPVELLSGIYETFLSSEKREKGAYYTPRHLANFAVDLAFADRPHPEAEVVYDPACGSGILLTTAYRRMLRTTEARAQRALSFTERTELLLAGIRGSDISEAACRVTAFSLYLALLEDLSPTDLARLRDDKDVKLPKLLGRILVGDDGGDFFTDGNVLANRAASEATVLLSNPPWAEPSATGGRHGYEDWASQHGYSLPHRNIAAAFAHKSVESVVPGGRVCLILPVKLFASDTSRAFTRKWIPRLRLKRIVNFADIRRLLFPTAVHPCVVVVGEPRDGSPSARLQDREWVDVWNAKADVSLAFGRLTIHGTDRHRIPAIQLAASPETFRLYNWGIPADHALIGKLRLAGTISDLLSDGATSRWQLVKGFNRTRHSSEPLDPGFLRSMQFLNARRIDRQVPVLDESVLEPFPSDIKTVVSYGSRRGAAFDGPRVLFPDGAASSFTPYAVFAKAPFCFQHTVAALRGPQADEDILRFVAAYLRSPLAAYYLFHTAYSLTTERTRVSLDEIAALPFSPPDKFKKRKRAQSIVRKVADFTRMIEGREFGRQECWTAYAPEVNELIFEYFSIQERERALIMDANDVLIPSVQPASYDGIRTPLRHRPTTEEISSYFARLTTELRVWRDRLGGKGNLRVEGGICQVPGGADAGIATITIEHETGPEEPRPHLETALAHQAVQWIQAAGLWPDQAARTLALSSDFLIYDDVRIHLVKPLVRRLWLERQAFDDARRIVESVQESPPIHEEPHG